VLETPFPNQHVLKVICPAAPETMLRCARSNNLPFHPMPVRLQNKHRGKVIVVREEKQSREWKRILSREGEN
jgi:hypothetical protein